MGQRSQSFLLWSASKLLAPFLLQRMPRFFILRPIRRVISAVDFVQSIYGVELTSHNVNHLDLCFDQVEVSWTNRFSDPDVAARRSEVLTRRHQRDVGFERVRSTTFDAALATGRGVRIGYRRPSGTSSVRPEDRPFVQTFGERVNYPTLRRSGGDLDLFERAIIRALGSK